MPKFAAEVLRRRLATMGAAERQVTIFHSRDGGVLTLHNLRRTFRDFVKDAGLDGLRITLRWYRRTGATVIARGLGLDAAAAVLGHTSTAVTQGHHVAADPTVDHAPAHVLDLTLQSANSDGRLLRSPTDATEENRLGRSTTVMKRKANCEVASPRSNSSSLGVRRPPLVRLLGHEWPYRRRHGRRGPAPSR